jgi:methylated-DNA-[protein]-cysteine S-methyltransferase
LDLIEYAVFESVFGNLLLLSRNGKLARLVVSSKTPPEIRIEVTEEYPNAKESPRAFRKAGTLLDRYFKGGRVDFNLEVDLSAMGEFTRRVLVETARIPYGEVRSYQWVARRIGRTKAARAVGQALKRNPIPIVIPCHRVIREDGSIGGFSLEGITKERLLSLEGMTKEKMPKPKK